MSTVEAPASHLPLPMQNILSRLAANSTEAEQALVRKAYAYAAAAHAGQVRLSGEPYLSHPLAVAEVLAELGFDAHSVAAGLLHDTVEDTKVTLEEVDAEFGEQVADIVDGVTKISMMTFDSKEEQQAENIRKMILAMSHDIRVPIVKLADRVHNMRTLDFQKAHKRQRIAQETMDIYVPLANRLGLHRLKLELEGLSFKYIHPDVYAQISDWLESNQVVERQLIAKIIAKLEGILSSNQIEGTVWGRIKHIYSIYKKMTEQNLTLDDMHDILAFRVIVKDVRDCYAVLGLVHAQWKPVPGRFKDYISMPKANGYQSLHTTVIGPEGERIEIQIRTERMDAVAERGIAAHWRYKGVNAGSDGSEMWMKQLRELMEDKTRPLAQNFDAKPSSGEIFVFTPGGDLRKLPEGATVLDFAFDIHTSLGLTCSGGKVNNRPAAIRDVLHNGDIVEVLTQKNQKPKADWLGFVTTSKARTRIKASLREEHTKNARLGREELERKLKNWKLPLTVDEGVGILCKHFKLRTGTELYASIGTEKIDLMQIKELLQAHLSGEAEEERRAAAAAIESEKRRKAEKVSTQSSGDALIIDEKIGQLDYKLAKCCNPIHGDEIFGFITVGAGITIHRTDCPNAQRLRRNYPYRVLEARWRDEAQGAFRVSIRVVASDTTGMINHIAEVINRDLKLSIRSMNLSPGGGLLSGVIHVEVPGTGMVDMLIHSILRIKGVQKAYRVNN